MAKKAIPVEEREYLTTAEAAERLGCVPYEIAWRAKNCPETLPFEVFLSGRKRPHVHVIKESFERYMRGERKTT